MINTVTLDSVVRKSLAFHQLPLHYYLPFYLHAKNGLEQLYFDALPARKTAVVSIDSANQGDLPADYLSDIFVAMEVGDKIKTLSRNAKINPRQNDTGFEISSQLPYTQADTDYDLFYEGKDWERGLDFIETYRILDTENKIRIDNRLAQSITEVTLCYLADAPLISSQSVLHKFGQQALLDWITWQWALHSPRNRFDPQIKRAEFMNSRRILVARMTKISPKDIIRSRRASVN